jgi:DNA-binding MarR family transcriptional regulator
MATIDQKHSTQAQLAAELKISKSLVSYYVNKAIKMGRIKELFRDRIRVLEVTQEGKNFLDQYGKQHTRPSGTPQTIFRAENIRFKARIYKLPNRQLDWNKVAMNNWSQYNSVIDDIKVHLNLGNIPSIEFIPSPINGNNPWELVGILYNDCTEAARKLEQTLRMY